MELEETVVIIASTFTWKQRTFVLHTPHTGYHHWGNKMSLYYTQKLLYQLNRDQSLQEKFFADKESVLTDNEKHLKQKSQTKEWEEIDK